MSMTVPHLQPRAVTVWSESDMSARLLGLLALCLLICPSSCRNFKGDRGGRPWPSMRLQVPNGRGQDDHMRTTSGQRIENLLNENDVNKLLPYEALENTDVRERQLLPNEIINKYYAPATDRKQTGKRGFTLIDRFSESSPRKKRQSGVISESDVREIKRTRLSGGQNALTNNEKKVLSTIGRKDKNVPEIIFFYKAMKENFSDSKRKLSERFVQSMGQSLPRDVPRERDPWAAMLSDREKHVLGLQPSGEEFPIPQAPSPSKGYPWPLPQSLSADPNRVFIVEPAQFHFKLTNNSYDSDVIREAMKRFLLRLTDLVPDGTARQDVVPNGTTQSDHGLDGISGTLRSLSIVVTGASSYYPSLKSDESYQLSVNAPVATVDASEVWGALHALETFTQMIYRCDHRQLCINESVVRDYPRYRHRGLLLDTSRHYLTPRVLKANMDAMAMNKLNAFHWHMVDDQSFPFVSQRFPRLSGKGAYSQSETYNHEVIRELVEYGRLRGIRIIPEFDTPGHTKSWGAGHPELLTNCGPRGVGPIDPSRNATYALLSRLFSEVMDLFPGNQLHLGGDECSYRCWSTSPRILEFMKAKGFGSDFSRLQQYYIDRLSSELSIIDKDREFLFWQEVVDNGVKVPTDSIIQVWKGWGGGGDGHLLQRVTSLGLRAIYSSGWYLNYVSYGRDWDKYYSLDPRQFVESTEAKRLVVGGEACVWGEFIDDNNLLQTTWPRASAVAERLWSPEHVNSVKQAEPRLEEHRCRMIRSNIPASPNSGPGSCSG